MNIKYWVWSIASAHFSPLISSFLFLTWQLLPRQHTTGILSEYSGCGRAPYALSPSRWVLGNTFPHDCSNTENWTWHLSMWLSLVSDYHSLQRLHYVLCGRWVSVQFSSVQFTRSVVPDSLRPHELQHARPPCPSPTPGVYSNSCPLSRWCHPAISSSVVPFSSCPQSLPASGSFPMRWVCTTRICLRLQHHSQLHIWSFSAMSHGSSCLLGTSVGCQVVI